MAEQFDLEFGGPLSIKGMVHSDDPETSKIAAQKINECKSKLHVAVLNAFIEHGNMTDSQLENLPCFRQYGPSTIRKRRSELYQVGKLTGKGEARNERGFTMVLWGI